MCCHNGRGLCKLSFGINPEQEHLAASLVKNQNHQRITIRETPVCSTTIQIGVVVKSVPLKSVLVWHAIPYFLPTAGPSITTGRM